MGKGEGIVEGRPDLDARDPNDINEHLKVAFEDVFAEPDGAHSNDCVWLCSYNCFNCAKNCCYRCLAIFCGCWTSLCWGFTFACVTFTHVWQLTPCLRQFSINCGFCQKVWGTCLTCFLAPICEAWGLCFSRVNVINSQG